MPDLSQNPEPALAPLPSEQSKLYMPHTNAALGVAILGLVVTAIGSWNNVVWLGIIGGVIYGLVGLFFLVQMVGRFFRKQPRAAVHSGCCLCFMFFAPMLGELVAMFVYN